jgi:hypothetical protein
MFYGRGKIKNSENKSFTGFNVLLFNALAEKESAGPGGQGIIVG